MARSGCAAYSEKRDGMICMRWFREGGADVGLVAGKGANLGKMVAADYTEGCIAERSRFKVILVTWEEEKGR